jgi:hypothetical protein
MPQLTSIPAPRACNYGPSWYRHWSRSRRLALELSVGVAILALIPIGVSVPMSPWLQLIGWTAVLACLVGQSILMVRWWRQRESARAAREGDGEIRR